MTGEKIKQNVWALHMSLENLHRIVKPQGSNPAVNWQTQPLGHIIDGIDVCNL